MKVDDFRREQDKQIERISDTHYIHHFDSNWKAKRDDTKSGEVKKKRQKMSLEKKEWLKVKDRMINDISEEMCVNKNIKPNDLYNKMKKSGKLSTGEKDIHYIYFCSICAVARQRAGLKPMTEIVEKMLRDGLTYQSIRDKTGVSLQYVCQIATRHGLNRPEKKKKVHIAIEMLEKNMSIKQVIDSGIPKTVAYRASKALKYGMHYASQ